MIQEQLLQLVPFQVSSTDASQAVWLSSLTGDHLPLAAAGSKPLVGFCHVTKLSSHYLVAVLSWAPGVFLHLES